MQAWWPRVACGLILGYLCLSRTFAYLGVPAWKVFVSEVVLAFLLLYGPQFQGRRWLAYVLRLPSLRRYLVWYGLFLAYGIAQVLHGILQGNPALIAARDLAFNYYPIYLLLGLWAGLMRPDLLPRVIRAFAWFNGIYGVLYIFLLNGITWSVPGVSREVVDVPIFPQPIYSFAALLGLLAYGTKFQRSWHLLILNAIVMLGMQFRTEWLAFAVGAVIWLLLTMQSKRVLQTTAILASLLALMYVTDVRLPVPELRGGGDISVQQLGDRVLAPFRADLGDMKSAAGVEGVDPQEATFVFRTVWWLAIWNSVHSDLQTAVLGHGYGFPLGDLVPYLKGEFIRTPHNEFFYALGYTGWIGVTLFALFQIEIFRLLWGAYRLTSKPFGIIYWIATMIFGMFFPLGETPYGAIPFYLLVGWCAAPVLLVRKAPVLQTDQQRSARLAGMNPSGATAAAS